MKSNDNESQSMTPNDVMDMVKKMKAESFTSKDKGYNDGSKKDTHVDFRFARDAKAEDYEIRRAEESVPGTEDKEDRKKKQRQFIDGYGHATCFRAGCAQFKVLGGIEVKIDPQGYRNLRFFMPERIPVSVGFNPSPVLVNFEVSPDVALREIEKLIEVMNEPDPVKEFWRDLTSPKSTRFDTPLDAYLKMYLATNNSNRKSTNIQSEPSFINMSPDHEYDGSPDGCFVGGEKFIPEEYWFDDAIIQNVKISDLLSIFPPAEQLMIALMLGRIVIGKSGKISTCGSSIEHTMRAMLVFVGKTPGLGKSEVMKYIIDALNVMGYNTATMFDPGAKFGWGKVVTRSLAYYDDLTPEKILELLKSPLVKSIVTGNEITTEDKYMPSITTTPECGIIACANSHDPRNLYQLDSGILSRVYLPSTHSVSGMKKVQKFMSGIFQDSKDLRIRSHWDFIASKLGLYSKDRKHCRTLALWLLKCSADLFLKTIGMEKTDNRYRNYQQVNPDTLEATCKLVDNFFEIPCNPNFGNTVFNSLVFAKNVIQLNDPSYVENQLEFNYSKTQLNWNSTQVKTTLITLEKMISFKGGNNEIYLALLCNHPLIRYLNLDWTKIKTLDDLSTVAMQTVKEKYPLPENRLFGQQTFDYLLDGCNNSIERLKSLCYYLFLWMNTLPNSDSRLPSIIEVLQEAQSYVLDSISSLDIPSIVKSVRKVLDRETSTILDERDMFKVLLGGVLTVDGYAPTSDPAWMKSTLKVCEQEFPTNEAHKRLLKSALSLKAHLEFVKELPRLNNEIYTFNAGVSEKDAAIPVGLIQSFN